MTAPEQPSPMVSADADVLTALFSPAGCDDPQAVLRGQMFRGAGTRW
jgi:hypothetical protein